MSRLRSSVLLLIVWVCDASRAQAAPAPGKPSLDALSLRARSLFYEEQDYVGALKVFREGAELAERIGNRERAALFRNAAGLAALGLYRYPEALAELTAGRRLARQSGAHEAEAAAAANLSATYLGLGDSDQAEAALAAAGAKLPGGSRYLAPILAQQARILLHSGDPARAMPAAAKAIDQAQRDLDAGSEAQVWTSLCLWHLDRGELEAAEGALGQAARLRVVGRLPGSSSISAPLGFLRLRQGRAAEALGIFERAQRGELGGRAWLMPWVYRLGQGRALWQMGRAGEGLKSLRQAWRVAYGWRQEVLPSQAVEYAADVHVSSVAAALADATSGVAVAESRHELVAEGWLAVEQVRSAALRRFLMARPALQRQGGEYAELVRRWRLASQANPAAGGILAQQAKLREIAARMTEIEAGSGLPGAHPAPEKKPTTEVRRLGQLLGPRRALYSFLLSEPRSHLWVLTARGLDHVFLPGRKSLHGQLREFRGLVAADSPLAAQKGRELYETLFGGAPADGLQTPEWLLSLDEEMFSTPLAALRAVFEGRERYLVEGRTLARIPSACWLGGDRPAAAWREALLVGDAIHNRADPRLRSAGGVAVGARLSFWIWPWPQTVREQGGRGDLPSLPGSLREIRAASGALRESGVETRVLRGAAANLEEVERGLRRAPSVVHFATHVVERTATGLERMRLAVSGDAGIARSATPWKDDAVLLLSLTASGARAGLDTTGVPVLEMRGGLVVLSACSSGLSNSATGGGLAGFTRAWLAAGASSVLATLWPAADDSGDLFRRFYAEMAKPVTPQAALRTAQMAMIRSSSWRAQPSRWATYFVVNKE